MNYLIIGNISSGKSSIALELSKTTNGEIYSIDDMRKEFSDGTFAGEFSAWAKMLEVIQHPSPNKDGYYEFSGTGKNAWFVRACIEYSQKNHKAQWAAVYCSCDKAELLNRSKDRKYNIPIPYKFDGVAGSIAFMSKELQERHGCNYWGCQEITVRTDRLTPKEAAEFVLAESKRG